METRTGTSRTFDTAVKTVAFLLPLAVILIVLSVYGIRYHTNDDATLANIAAGAYGDVYHMVYVNMLFSVILRPFYALASANWYAIVQIALVAVSMGCVGVVLVKKNGALSGLLQTMCLTIPFAIPVFYMFQYTKNAAIISAGGLVLIARELGSFSFAAILGCILALLGSLIRFEAFAMAGALFAVPLLFGFFRLDGTGKKKAVILMVVLLSSVFVRKGIDIAYYNSDEGWKTYREYNRARMNFSDHKMYLVGRENPFSDKGVSDIDYEMLRLWDFFDEERFSRDFLNGLSDGVDYPPLSDSLKALPGRLFETAAASSYGKATVFFLCLTVLFSILFRGKRLWALLFQIAVFLAVVTYLTWSQRMPSYVDLGLFFSLIAGSLCISLPDEKMKIVFPASAVLLLACLAVTVPTLRGLRSDSRYYKDWATWEQSYFEEMSRHKENLYLLATESINVAAGLDVWHPRTDGFYSNIVAFGGWLSNAPHRKEVLRNYGLERPIADAVDKENVFLDYHNIRNVTAYASQEAGTEVEAVSVGDNAFVPYQLKSKP